MIITPRQITAARDMLLMSQLELGDAAGVSERTVNKAEAIRPAKKAEGAQGQTVSDFVSYESLSKIKKTLEARGVKFIGTRGVMLLEETEAKAFEGEDAPFIFYEDVLAAAKNKDEIFAVYDTAETLARSLGVVNFSDLRRLEEISRHTTVKLLLTKPEKSELELPFFQVRWMTRYPFSYQSKFICGKLHATIETVDGKHFSYYESNSLELALAGKSDFSTEWATSTQIAETMKPLKKKVRA